MNAKQRRRTRRATARHNPPLVIFSNPPGKRRRAALRIAGQLSRDVHEIRYTHQDDGQPYKHAFGGDVGLFALSDGSVLLRHAKGKPLWQEFPDPR